MKNFTNDQLASMQAKQKEMMQDTCRIQTYADGVTNEYGKPTPKWTEREIDIPCGVSFSNRQWESQGTEESLIERVIRLPMDTIISQKDRVRVTHRFGVALTSPEVYEVLGEAIRGASGLRVNVRRVTISPPVTYG